MKSKRSRLYLLGVLVLALSVTVGLASGSVADAKKKKKKKSTNVVTVASSGPVTIPASASANAVWGLATVPLTVGKAAKGKVVGWDSLTVTSTFSAATNPALGNVFAEITAPNGRTRSLTNPQTSPFALNTVSGPMTETPDSPVNPCFPDATHPCPGGFNRDPDATLGPPYAGTIGNDHLSFFGGVPAKGTWTVHAFNTSTTTTATLNSVSITLTLRNSPP